MSIELRESLLKLLKITFKKTVKPILRCRKTINSPKILFVRSNFAKNDLHTP